MLKVDLKRFLSLIIISGLLLPTLSFADCPISEHRRPHYSKLLAPTLNLTFIQGFPVAYQNGIPLSSFEIQESRLYLDLGGVWKAFYDGKGDHKLSLAFRNREVLDRFEAYGFHTLDFNDSLWEDEVIPCSNNVRGGRHEGYQGVVWYRRFFQVPEEFKGMFIKLVFQGSNYITDVWVNEEYLGYHEGGFTPFAFDVTDKLNFNRLNLIAVRVDNIPWDSVKTIVPYRRCDWWNYGGIYREVYLEASPMVHVARVDAAPVKLGLNYGFKIRVLTYNGGCNSTEAYLKLRIFKAEMYGDDILTPFSSRLIKDRSDCLAEAAEKLLIKSKNVALTEKLLSLNNPRFWSPDEPNLYVVEVELESHTGIDRFSTQVGLRFVEKSDTNILLNGRPIFLKGLARHEEYPSIGRTLKPEDIFRDLKLIKDAGANWIRTGHYPNHPLTYIYADRLGLAVWEEIPVYWFDDEAYDIQLRRGLARQMLLEMVLRDYNRASILFWGLSNEGGGHDARIEFLRDLCKTLKLIDDTRLTSEAMFWNPWDDTWSHGGLDIPSFNLYFGVFYGSVKDLDYALEEFHRLNPDTPLLVTEFGLWSGGGVGEEGQVKYFEEAWERIASKPYVAGACWWTAFDYDSMINFNTFGAVDWDRSHFKLLYKTIKKKYESPRPIYIMRTDEYLNSSLDFTAAFILMTTLVLIIVFKSFSTEKGRIHSILIAGAYILLGILCTTLSWVLFIASSWISQLRIAASILLTIGILSILLSILTFIFIVMKFKHS